MTMSRKGQGEGDPLQTRPGRSAVLRTHPAAGCADAPVSGYGPVPIAQCALLTPSQARAPGRPGLLTGCALVLAP